MTEADQHLIGCLTPAEILALPDAQQLGAAADRNWPRATNGTSEERMGADPAYGSGPIATTVQDVLSLATYFGCVLLVVLRRGPRHTACR